MGTPLKTPAAYSKRLSKSRPWAIRPFCQFCRKFVENIDSSGVAKSFKSFNFYGEFNNGQQIYATTAKPFTQVPVNVNGYSGTITYFLTGEEITQFRARVKPLHPYNWRAGEFGAVEAFTRFSNVHLGDNILHNGLLLPTANANQVNATDVGVHWYWNEFVKMSFNWQHATFNSPISTAPGNAAAKTINNQDLFWVRWQLYY